MLWIPAYSANLLVRLDPATGQFKEIPLPVKDAVPYVTRGDPRDGAIPADAFLAAVHRADGTVLPASQPFVTNFEALQTTGDWAN